MKMDPYRIRNSDLAIQKNKMATDWRADRAGKARDSGFEGIHPDHGGQLDALFLAVKHDCYHQLEPTERHSADYLRIKAAIDLIAQELLQSGEVVTIAELMIQA